MKRLFKFCLINNQHLFCLFFSNKFSFLNPKNDFFNLTAISFKKNILKSGNTSSKPNKIFTKSNRSPEFGSSYILCTTHPVNFSLTWFSKAYFQAFHIKRYYTGMHWANNLMPNQKYFISP